MADVIGTIAACVELAEKIADLVKKFVGAWERIQTIASDVSLLESILKQLDEILSPDPSAGITAARLSPHGRKNASTAVQRCKEIFRRIREELVKTLYDKRFQAKLARGETISVNWAVRLFWIFKESSISELREELSRSKQDVMLSLSVIQLSIAKQPAQELDRLRVTVELLWAYQQSKNVVIAPSPTLPPFDADATSAITSGPTGDKDIIISGNGTVPQNKSRMKIERVSRSLIAPEILDEERIRWLNDPFEQDMVTIYDELSEGEFRRLCERSRPRPLERVERERLNGRVPQSAVLEPAELRMKEREKAKPSPPFYRPSEDIVDILINEWTLPSNSPNGTLSAAVHIPGKKDHLAEAKPEKGRSSPLTSRECGRSLQKGEWMYSCKSCGKGDDIVFCEDCFNSTDHTGHIKERRRGQNSQGYCDCGQVEAVKKPSYCSIHGWYDSRGPLD
ncbi:MAG: hypothetical protein M1821_008276 [Bathelium mastoideum]|nr:MAG: hypothetical protein M1821_008276 [Bathelium mastoideum]